MSERKGRVRKFVKMTPLTTQQAVTEILARRYVFLHDRPMHPSWLGSWSLQLLDMTCAKGHIFGAIINPDYVEKEIAE